jgi:hypothetical protein
MRIVWRGDDDEANFIDGEKFIERADAADIGILLGGFVAAALQNRGEPQSGHSANHLRVKSAASQPESDEANIDHESIQKGMINVSVKQF